MVDIDLQQVSLEFDILYNNITSNQAPGLNVYEKSLFLTKAQDELIKNYFLASHNTHQEGYLGTSKREYDFSNLIVTETYNNDDKVSDVPQYYYNKNNSVLYKYPKDAFLTLNEQLVWQKDIGNGLYKYTMYQIVPIDYQMLQTLMKKPYKLPLKGQAWKLLHYSKQEDKYVEFIGNFSNKTDEVTYQIRYVKHPKPIIVARLSQIPKASGTYTIKGDSEESKGSVPPEMMEEVIQRAVEIAKNSWQGDIDHTVQMGQRSE